MCYTEVLNVSLAILVLTDVYLFIYFFIFVFMSRFIMFWTFKITQTYKLSWSLSVIPNSIVRVTGCFFKGSQLDAFSPNAIVYCYIEFKLSYLKNLKLFSIRAKELSEPIILWRKATGFSSFYKHFLEKPIFEWR